MMMKHAKRLAAGLFLFAVIVFAPQIWQRLKFKDLLLSQIEATAYREFAVVFGAR